MVFAVIETSVTEYPLERSIAVGLTGKRVVTDAPRLEMSALKSVVKAPSGAKVDLRLGRLSCAISARLAPAIVLLIIC